MRGQEDTCNIMATEVLERSREMTSHPPKKLPSKMIKENFKNILQKGHRNYILKFLSLRWLNSV